MREQSDPEVFDDWKSLSESGLQSFDSCYDEIMRMIQQDDVVKKGMTCQTCNPVVGDVDEVVVDAVESTDEDGDSKCLRDSCQA